MGMVRPAGEELLQDLAKTPLAGLASILDIDIEKWLPFASSPLPVTMRLTPRRHDIDWTRQKLESVGGKRIPWIVSSESWVMPFSKNDYPDKETKRLKEYLSEKEIGTGFLGIKRYVVQQEVIDMYFLPYFCRPRRNHKHFCKEN